MHAAAYAWIYEALRALPAPPRRVLEYGSRYINGTVRNLLPATAYVGVDLHQGPCVDVVGDAAEYDPPDAPDLVVCAETLEHAPNAEALVRKALAVLKPGGHLVVTCAGPGRAPHSAVDGGPLRAGEFYRNLPAAEIVGWIQDAGGEALTSREDRTIGDTYVCARKPALVEVGA